MRKENAIIDAAQVDMGRGDFLCVTIGLMFGDGAGQCVCIPMEPNGTVLELMTMIEVSVLADLIGQPVVVEYGDANVINAIRHFIRDLSVKVPRALYKGNNQTPRLMRIVDAFMEATEPIEEVMGYCQEVGRYDLSMDALNAVRAEVLGA